MRELIGLLQLTIVNAQELPTLQGNKEAAVKQDQIIIDGLVMNVDVKTKKKHNGNENIKIGVEDVLESLKEFMKEMQSKYAVLDRPPSETLQS